MGSPPALPIGRDEPSGRISLTAADASETNTRPSGSTRMSSGRVHAVGDDRECLDAIRSAISPAPRTVAQTPARVVARSASASLFDGGADEEVRVHPPVQADRVGEREVAEVVGGDQVVFDELIGLLDHEAHVGDVEVADVGAEHGVEPGTERIELGVEGECIEAVVAFAAEVEVRNEEIVDVARFVDRQARQSSSSSG